MAVFSSVLIGNLCDQWSYNQDMTGTALGWVEPERVTEAIHAPLPGPAWFDLGHAEQRCPCEDCTAYVELSRAVFGWLGE